MENREYNSREEERPVDFYYSSLEEELQKELEDSEARLTPSKTEGRIILEIQEEVLSDFLNRLLIQEDRQWSNEKELMQKEICNLKAMLAEAQANQVPLSGIQPGSLKEQLNINTELLKAQCDLEQQTSNCMYLQGKLNKMKIEKEDLQATLEKVKVQNEELLASLKEIPRESLKEQLNINTELRKAQCDLEQQTSNCVYLKGKLNKMKIEKEDLQATLEKVKVQNEELLASLKEIPRESLKEQLNINTELRKAQCDLEQQTSNCVYLKGKLNKIKIEKEEFQATLERMKVQNEELLASLKEIPRESLQEQLNINTELRKAQCDLEQQTSNCVYLKGKLNKMKIEKEDLQATLEKVKVQNEELLASLKEIPRESLQEQLNINTELRKAQCDLEQQTSNCVYLKGKLNKMKIEKEEFQATLERMKVQNEDLHSNFTKIEEEKKDLQVKLTGAKAEKEELQVQLELMKVEKQDLKVNLIKRKGRNYDLQAGLQKIKKEKEDLQLTLEKTKMEKENLKLSLRRRKAPQDPSTRRPWKTGGGGRHIRIKN